MTRTQARENAFILIFEKLFNPENSFEDMKALAEATEVFEIDAFTEQLYSAVEANTESADALISKYSRGWKIERLSKVVLSILRLAVSEITAMEDIPDSVSVNEAVELAKKYGNDADPAFINGILSSVIKGKSEQ